MEKTLDLVLKSKWYDMITSGEKREEYREIKPCWIKRLCDNPVFNSNRNLIGRKAISDWTIRQCKSADIDLIKAFHRGNMIAKEFAYVRFRRGYTNKGMVFKVESVIIGKGNPEWGAPDHDVFIIKLGQKIKTSED